MEDLKLRLKCNDIAVQSRCIQKLLNAVKKRAIGEIITASSVQVPELNLIWETCVEDSTSSSLAVQAILYLAVNKFISLKYAINKFLSSINAVSNVTAIVKGISTLLIHENIQNVGNQKLPQYSLHFPKHPLITVLQERNDSFPVIIESIVEVLFTEMAKNFQVVEPVICYILTNPVQKHGYDCSKLLLLEAFSDIMRKDSKVVLYILKFLPFLQVETFSQILEASSFVAKLNKIVAELDFSKSDYILICETLMLVSISLSERCVDHGHIPSNMLKLAKKMCQNLCKIDCESSYVNICMILLSRMLQSTISVPAEDLADVGLELLKLKPVSCTVSAILAFSVIQILPLSTANIFNEVPKSSLPLFLKKLEEFFLKCQDTENYIENDESPTFVEKCENIKFLEGFTASVTLAANCSKFSVRFDFCNLNSKIEWLKCIQEQVKNTCKQNFDVVFSLTAAIFLLSPEDHECLNSCLETFEIILSKNNNLSTRMFALLLYKQSLVEDPELKFLILEYLPKCTMHKYAVPPVINILTLMVNNNDLRAQAIYLMLLLWKKQDRCFPYLHKLLMQPSKVISSDTGVNETLIAQAACIKEICLILPEKHGKELLGTLSSIFNESHDNASSPVACLALDGVIALCRSEVIDLRSTWKVLCPRLIKDKRVTVSCRMYRFLELVPELRVKSFEYDKFINEIAASIWKQISSGISSPLVASAAYRALAKFPLECHVLKQLPSAAKGNLKLPASMKATPFDMSKSPEDVLTYIPGYCFTDLLKSIDDDCTIEGYTEFLTSLIKQEVAELPRSVYNQKRQFVKPKSADGVLAKVPGFLCSQFEARKSPALQKNLAVGVLLCYEPPVELGKDGQPTKRALATQLRLYEQVLSVLLNEVNIDTNEWQRCILLPTAWGSFMEHAFFACEEARKADLELQYSHGLLDVSKEELNTQCKLAWLWVRDRFLNVIKTNGKNTSTSHANSIFAIAGLILATDKFYGSLDETSKSLSDENEKFVNYRTFQSEYTETILCAMKPDYQPSVKLHSWLLTHLSRPNSSACFLVRGCASSALCNLTPVLSNVYPDEIPHLCQVMLQNLTHSSPVMSFYSGLGLGLFIRSLCECGFSEVGEMQANLLLNTCKKVAKICNIEENCGSSCIIALAISITSLIQTSHEDTKEWISDMCYKFHEKLMEEEKSSMNFEVLSVCVSVMVIGAAEGNCVPVQDVENLVSWFEENRSQALQCSGISVSCGMLIESLERFGHADASKLKQKLQKDWFNTLTSEKKPTLHKIAALNGLCALYSQGRGFMLVKSQKVTESALNDLIQLMFQMLSASRDTGVQSICSWEIGHLFSVHSNQQQVESSVSASYSYLSEKSILKPLMNMILDSIKKDESSPKFHHSLSCLRALMESFSRPLPPINWVTVLTPFLQDSEDPITVEAALKIAVNQSSSSSSAVSFISLYCTPPLIHTLPENAMKLLLQNIPVLSLTLPAPKLQVFLQTIISCTVKQKDQFSKLGCLTLQGIGDSLKQSGYKQQSLDALQAAFTSVFKYFKANPSYAQEHLSWISEGLECLPAKSVDLLLSVSQNNSDISVLMMIWCYLVKMGKQPLSMLKPCIEEGKHAPQEEKEKLVAYLYDCFLSGVHNKKSEISQPKKCMSWLLETIGWINVLEDSKSKYSLLTIGQVYAYLVDVCLATICGCAGLESSYSFLPLQRMCHEMLLETLPVAISKLFQEEEWKKIADKIIDWLLVLLKSMYLNEKEKSYVKLCLLSLRVLTEFRKPEIWTEVVCSVNSETK